jgi:nucleotide-binding universal stress UspA family protein
MKWVVGIDLRVDCQGPVSFARWLGEHASSESFVGMHVIEDRELPIANETAAASIAKASKNRACELLTSVDAMETIGEPEIPRGKSADQSLSASLETYEAHGLIIGRRAPQSEDRIVRLGRVARRLLRTLPGPIIITAPDLDATKLPPGPVVVGVSLGHDCEPAVREAARLAHAIGRKLVMFHTQVLPTGVGVDFLPALLDDLKRHFQKEVRPRVEEWTQGLKLEGARLEFGEGPVVAQLLGCASREQACMIVLGSRRLGRAERFFASGSGFDLASAAPVPVLIVPP